MNPEIDTYYVILDAAKCDSKNVSINYLKWEGRTYLF
jgi:hypothetical protein